MSLSIKIGNILFKNAYALYKPLYFMFKQKQDKFEIQLLEKYIKSGDTVIDIGANIGFYAKILSQLVGDNGFVHSFEPDAINFKHLQKETKGIKNISINNKAVSDKTEHIKIYTSKELNVDHRTYKPENYDSEIDVDAICLDDYVKQHNLKPHLIKMDIQGYEMVAIKGMITTLKENPDVVLISEFWPYGLNKAKSSAMEYYNYLRAIGFNCYLIQNDRLNPLTNQEVERLQTFKEDKTKYYNILASRVNV